MEFPNLGGNPYVYPLQIFTNPATTLQTQSPIEIKPPQSANSAIFPATSSPLPVASAIGLADDDDDIENFDLSYFESIPPGYRFCPTDYELITHYLKPKISHQPLPRNKIIEVNLYKHNPQNLAEKYKKFWDSEFYFFTHRDKKYPKGNRPSRAAGDGYWKASGAFTDIFDVKNNNEVIGGKRSLVFYLGKPPKGEKTNWIMYEYKIKDSDPSPRVRTSPNNNMRLDDYVLCIIKNSWKSNSKLTSPSSSEFPPEAKGEDESRHNFDSILLEELSPIGYAEQFDMDVSKYF